MQRVWIHKASTLVTSTSGFDLKVAASTWQAVVVAKACCPHACVTMPQAVMELGVAHDSKMCEERCGAGCSSVKATRAAHVPQKNAWYMTRREIRRAPGGKGQDTADVSISAIEVEQTWCPSLV